MATNGRRAELPRNPSVNKATACTEAEKESLGLVGLVPDNMGSTACQVQRSEPFTANPAKRGAQLGVLNT